MFQKSVVDRPLLPQTQNRTFKVHRVPQRDRGNHQVQPAGPIALIFEGTIADFAKSIKENSSCEGVPRFPFVEAYLNPSGAALDLEANGE